MNKTKLYTVCLFIAGMSFMFSIDMCSFTIFSQLNKFTGNLFDFLESLENTSLIYSGAVLFFISTALIIFFTVKLKHNNRIESLSK